MAIKRTDRAAAAVRTSSLFAAKFGERFVSRHLPALLEPPGMSTEGGAQAQQQLVLQPRDSAEATINFGSVNNESRTVKLRTFDCLLEVHSRRFGNQPFVIEPTEYQLFFEDVANFLMANQFEVTVEERPPEIEGRTSRRPPAPRAVGGPRALWMWALAATLLAVGIFAYLLWRGL